MLLPSGTPTTMGLVPRLTPSRMTSASSGSTAIATGSVGTTSVAGAGGGARVAAGGEVETGGDAGLVVPCAKTATTTPTATATLAAPTNSGQRRRSCSTGV